MRMLMPMQVLRRLAACLCFAAAFWASAAVAAEDTNVKSLGGLTAYLGVLPAELVKGPAPHSADKPMHGRSPKGPHEFHVVVALFDAATGARVPDAAVTANISGIGMAGTEKQLQPMRIADTTTYGSFFTLGRDLYAIKVSVNRAGTPPVTFNFRYDHRR